MLALYDSLAKVALVNYPDIVAGSAYVGGTFASPNKLRLSLIDSSFLDIWLSADGDYAYHWEQRRQSGRMYRWDNAPHYPTISTFPAHFHDSDESKVIESRLSGDPEQALLEILGFIRQQLAVR